MGTDAAIDVRRVTKSFGAVQAVRDLDLTVPRGGLYGFIGPNGAGKTTTLRMIMSILLPDSGELSVLGQRSALKAKDRIGYLPEERGVYRRMRVGAFLTFMARLKGRGGPAVAGRVRSLLERVGLPDVEQKRCEELSKGMLQKVQLAATIIGEPDLLILDEPFSGIDPVNMRLLRNIVLEEHRRGATIVFSTHVMVHAEEICDHIVMMHGGRKVLDESLTDIRGRHDPRTIRFEPLDSDADAGPPLAGVRGVERVTRDAGAYRIDLVDGADPAGVMRDVTAAVAAARIELQRPTLEDVFVGIATGVKEPAA